MILQLTSETGSGVDRSIPKFVRELAEADYGKNDQQWFPSWLRRYRSTSQKEAGHGERLLSNVPAGCKYPHPRLIPRPLPEGVVTIRFAIIEIGILAKNQTGGIPPARQQAISSSLRKSHVTRPSIYQSTCKASDDPGEIPLDSQCSVMASISDWVASMFGAGFMLSVAKAVTHSRNRSAFSGRLRSTLN